MEQNSFNAKGMKLQNKRNIMDSLRVSPCSRAELARQTGLTRAAIRVSPLREKWEESLIGLP